MTKKEIIALLAGTFFLLTMVFAVVFTFIGFIPFLFSKKLIDYIGILLILTVISFAYLTFSFFNGREGKISKKLILAVKALSVVFSVIFILLGLLITLLFMSDPLIKRSVSPDKKYEAYVLADGLFGTWDVTVYKRRTLFFKSEVDSLCIRDMADKDGEISISWTDVSCDISYEYYPEYSGNETKTITDKIYYASDK